MIGALFFFIFGALSSIVGMWFVAVADTLGSKQAKKLKSDAEAANDEHADIWALIEAVIISQWDKVETTTDFQYVPNIESYTKWKLPNIPVVIGATRRHVLVVSPVRMIPSPVWQKRLLDAFDQRNKLVAERGERTKAQAIRAALTKPINTTFQCHIMPPDFESGQS